MKWLVAALLAVSLSAPPAHAHASLIAAEPADGAVLARAPATLRLTFDEPVTPLVLRLIGAGGHTAMLTNFTLEGPSVVITPPPLGQGTHALSWRVVSADGHPVGGTVLFSVGAPGERPALENAGDPSARAALWLAKIVLYVGLFIGIGGAFFRAWLADDAHGTRAIAAALVAGLVATPITVGLQGLDALELPLSGLAAKVAWQTGFATSYGATAAVAAFALLAGLFSIAPQAIPIARGLSLAAMIGCGLALALSGHASAADPQWLMRPAVFVHAVGVAFWSGALAPLAVALRAGGGQAALMRFSRAAPFVLAAMVAAGLVLAIVQLETVSALWSTAYGLVLSAKLAAVAGLIVLAAVNRWSLTARVAQDDRARTRLVKLIAAELALVVVILALVAAWRFTPPPRALARAAEAPALLHIHTDRLMADLTLEPGRAGRTQATIMILRGDFTPFEPKEVVLILSNPAAGIEPIRRAAMPRDGTWRVDALTIPLSGTWQVRVDVLVSDFEKVSLEDAIEIRR